MTNTTSSHANTVSGESAIAARIEAEYLEMPGLRLTLPQAARLWGLDTSQSAQLLGELTAFVDGITPLYEHVDRGEIRFVLLQGGDRLMPEIDPAMARARVPIRS